MSTGSDSKPNCPLCLFAVEQLETMLKDNRTEVRVRVFLSSDDLLILDSTFQTNIQNALDNLCSHLPSKLKPECVDFVDTYSKQLVEMLAIKFSPQEVCVFLKICVDNRPAQSVSLADDIVVNDFMEAKMNHPADQNRFRKPVLPQSMLANSNGNEMIETNEIPDFTINGKTLVYPDFTPKTRASPQCVMCEFIMTQIDNQLKDKATDDEIKKIVHDVCDYMPKNVKTECNNFVDKYADAVIALLTKELSPKDVCTALNMCSNQSTLLQGTHSRSTRNFLN
jgi:saposin